MQYKLTEDRISPDYVFRKGTVIDQRQVPADQLSRWVERGVVVPVEDVPLVDPVHTAVADKPTRKAVTRK